MNKRPDFAEDLTEIGRDVTESVSAMLSLVNGKKMAATAVKRELPPAIPKKLKQARKRTLSAVSTRLPHATKQLLKEAVHRQYLAKAAATTEQAIIEEALQQWFKRKGYAPPDAVTHEASADEPTSEK